QVDTVRMSIENPLWGAPRIHGELLKLGFEIAQSTVAKYMVKWQGPPSQGWCTFLRNHAPDIGAIDLFVVPTFGFNLLYTLIIVRLDRRHLIWVNVTTNPTAEWIARQLTEAFPWHEAPHWISTCCAAGVVAENSRSHLNNGKKVKPETGWNPTASSARQSSLLRLLRMSARDARDSAPLAGRDAVSVSRNRPIVRSSRCLSHKA